MNELLGNILPGLSLAAPIGPSGLAVIQNGLRHGFWRAFLTGLGVTLADLGHPPILSGFFSCWAQVSSQT